MEIAGNTSGVPAGARGVRRPRGDAVKFVDRIRNLGDGAFPLLRRVGQGRWIVFGAYFSRAANQYERQRQEVRCRHIPGFAPDVPSRDAGI